MFKKKINEKLNEIFKELYGLTNVTYEMKKKLHDTYVECSRDRTTKTIESQQKTIEQLTDALCDKYKHGLFIFSEDGKIPKVIRNGKELTNDLTTGFSISWDRGEFPDIRFEQIGGTWKDDEEE